MERQQDGADLDDSDDEPVYLPQVDTDNAVSIWCGLPKQGGPSAWMAAVEEQSTSNSSDFYDAEDEEEDEEDEEDEEEDEAEDEESSSESESSVPTEMLHQWKRMRERYTENQDVAGDILVQRVLMYMGHPHWRKGDPASFSPAGDNRQISNTMAVTMAVRLEDLRQKRLQKKAARRNLKHHVGLASLVAYEALRQSVRQLKKELVSLSHKRSKAEESDESASAKKQDPATSNMDP